MKQKRIHWTAIAVSAVLGLAGCSSTGGSDMKASEDAKPRETVSQTTVQPPAAPAARLETVYFELDRSDLGAEARQELSTSAEWIRSQPELGVVTIEGHCDERGSEAYNVALGMRRAEAVRSYLVGLGVPKARLEVVTYGESRPAVTGSGEGVWRLNRRSEMHAAREQAAR